MTSVLVLAAVFIALVTLGYAWATTPPYQPEGDGPAPPLIQRRVGQHRAGSGGNATGRGGCG